MRVIAPINYIEISNEHGEQIARIAGTPFTVGEVAHMVVYGDSLVEWVVQNYTSLDHAKVHAALSYSYDHREELDSFMARAEEEAGRGHSHAG